jgi:hypothetical protein
MKETCTLGNPAESQCVCWGRTPERDIAFLPRRLENHQQAKSPKTPHEAICAMKKAVRLGSEAREISLNL